VRDKRVVVRYSEEELALIEEAAWRRKVKRAEWLRNVTLATAKKTIEEAKK
jgi:uncharacterized protein (DUF1778 family)